MALEELKNMDLLKLTSVYAVETILRPILENLIKENDDLKKELLKQSNLLREKIEHYERYYKFDKGAYEEDLIKSRTHIRSCTGDLLKDPRIKG
jgi:hypothetical protein